MKIKSSLLSEFFKKCSSGGLIYNGYINFEKRGIHFIGQKASIMIYEGLIKKEVFENPTEYTELGKFVIRDINLAKNIVDSFPKIVEMVVGEDNYLLFRNEKRKVLMRLGSEDSIEDIPEPKLEYEKNIRIKIIDLKNLKKDFMILSNKSMPLVLFNLSGKELNIEMSNNEDSIFNTIKFVEEQGFGKVLIDSDFLDKIFTTLNSEYVSLGIKTDFPLKIVENVGNYTLSKWIIAPREYEDEKNTSTKISETDMGIEDLL